ncbi:conserved hypothetical protein [Mycolicibacter sinensis]|uniref:Uncharacterized protein n=3 Tax=Mycobacteriaceae TaxID=1762 RepID=F5YWG3_MYCSD|nr:conserved hypothetical protein [Mycolicibacter sinensis]
MSDLPPGEWSAWLVGASWPEPPTQPTFGISFWSGHADIKEQEASELDKALTFFGQNNSGHTADDMITKLRTGIKRLRKVRDDCRAKSAANSRVADAVNNLRDRLTEIARQGNQEINAILSRQGSLESKLPEINRVIAEANALATGAGIDANTAIVTATQSMFNDMDVDEDAQKWLQDHGANFGTPPRQHISADDLDRTAHKGGGVDGGGGATGSGAPSAPTRDTGSDAGMGGSGTVGATPGGTSTPSIGTGTDGGAAGSGNSASTPGGTSTPTTAGTSGTTPGGTSTPTTASTSGTTPRGGVTPGSANSGSTASNGSGQTAKTTTAGGTTTGSAPPPGSPAPAGTTTPGGTTTGSAPPPGSPAPVGTTTPGGTTVASKNPLPAGVTTAGSNTGFGVPSTPSGGGGGSSALSSMPGLGGGSGGSMPPGLQGGGLSQPFGSGMPGGPSGPGALGGPQSPLSHSGMDGSGLSQSSAPQVPPSPSSTPMAGGLLGNLGHLAGSSQEVAPTAPTTGATPTPAPPSVTTGPAAAPSAPISAAPAAPSGPLPGYGADLRPATGTAPGVPAATAGAPAAPTSPPPGGPTTPASGGTTVASSSDRSTPGRPSPGPAGQSGAAMAGGMAAGATAGAGAGTAAKRLAEHQDLQRKVDAVARQAPNLAWAAGLRDDETTTVVVTDLAGGWIPPTVTLPPGVTLLEPAHRRSGTSAVDLLGAVIAAATHEPNTYITEADPHDPPVPGTGERARYGQHVDELGPTLIDVAGSSTRLPRIVQTVAQAMARRSGVADNEVDLFRQVVADTAARVLSAYPEHAPRDVADWMLLAAVDALIDGSEELARYHLAWHETVAVRHGGVLR